jgi:Sap, sulfolipid-1-addressing protein
MLIQSRVPSTSQPPRHGRATVGLRSRLQAGMAQVFLIAVVSAFDAGLLTAAVVLLARPRPARQLGAYLIGGIGFSIIFGLLIVLALHGSNLRIGRSTQGVIEVVAGALLILIAVAECSGRIVQWHPRRTRKRDADHSERQSLHDRALGQDSLWIAWGAGALYSAPGAYYLAGLALLAKQNVSATTNVLVILGFNLIQFALIELPLLGLVLMPDRTRSLTEKLNDWMTAHRRIVIVVLAGTIGSYLLISGISDLS